MILDHDKIAIVGYAETGKTRCSELFVDRPVIHSDDYLDKVPWIHFLFKAIDDKNKFCMEGIGVLNLLRAYEKNYPLADLVIRLEPKFPCKAKHRAQRKAIDTMWNQWLSQKPECRIIIINEDVLEFMIGLEQQLAKLFAVFNSTPERQIHKSWLTGDITKAEFKISRGSSSE